MFVDLYYSIKRQLFLHKWKKRTAQARKQQIAGAKWAAEVILKTRGTSAVFDKIDEARTFGNFTDFDSGAEQFAYSVMQEMGSQVKSHAQK